MTTLLGLLRSRLDHGAGQPVYVLEVVPKPRFHYRTRGEVWVGNPPVIRPFGSPSPDSRIAMQSSDGFVVKCLWTTALVLIPLAIAYFYVRRQNRRLDDFRFLFLFPFLVATS